MLLLDTNVLAYAHDPASKNHERAMKLVESALRGELEACISCQNIAELYAVLTRTLKLATPYKASEAAEVCELYAKSKNLLKIMPTEQTYMEALRLAERTGATSTKIFDCLLVATALENGIDTIYTENTEDFEPIESIKAINPFHKK